VGAFDAFITDDPTNVRVDVTRVASYVAAGVGFIGGGVIIKHAGSVRGITTATSLWTAAAIGLAAGLGFWAGAIGATVIALIALAALKPLSDWVGRRAHPPRTLVVVVATPTAATDVLRAVQEEAPGAIRSMQVGQGESAAVHELAVQFWHQPDDDTVRRLLERIEHDFGDDVRSVNLLG
jgi:putative Mg2+ transporter-C (MgtC) family protein